VLSFFLCDVFSKSELFGKKITELGETRHHHTNKDAGRGGLLEQLHGSIVYVLHVPLLLAGGRVYEQYYYARRR
jgi:hypothetical protein